jgi:polyphenol oxidase
MLQRKVSADGVVYYTSPLLERAGAPHAFSTRLGGVSPAPFDSLNLGNPAGCARPDDDGRIRENYRRLFRAIGCERRTMARATQVHGAGVVRVSAENAAEPREADALVTDDVRCIVTVRVADCVPVLVGDEGGRQVAAIHAGWRGAVAGVVPAAIDALRRRGAKGLVAAIGPCISADAFEVGPEVIEAFERILGARAPVRRRADGKGHVDVREAVRLQLCAADVPPDRIDTTDRCTVRDADEFFSHRRDAGLSGRLAGVIGPRA